MSSGITASTGPVGATVVLDAGGSVVVASIVVVVVAATVVVVVVEVVEVSVGPGVELSSVVHAASTRTSAVAAANSGVGELLRVM
jgi:hypothetical protein